MKTLNPSLKTFKPKSLKENLNTKTWNISSKTLNTKLYKKNPKPLHTHNNP
jgi:hypothetical protein